VIDVVLCLFLHRYFRLSDLLVRMVRPSVDGSGTRLGRLCSGAYEAPDFTDIV
jgi:hypothetical protein